MRRLAQRWWLVGLVLLAAVGGATAVLVSAEHAHAAQRRQAAEQEALVMLRGAVQDVLGRQAALAHLIGVLHTPIGSRWDVFSQTVMSQPLANSTAFVVPVSGRRRAQFERRTGLRVLVAVRPGVFAPAPHRSEYFVVEHADERGSRPVALGGDAGASPMRRALLVRSARTGDQLATPPVALVSAAGARGVAVFTAVRGPNGGLRGWVSVTYQASGLAAMITHSLPGARLTIRDGTLPLVGDSRRPAGMAGTISVAGRTWRVWTLVPGTVSDAVAWLVLGLGLALTAAVALILRQAVVREGYASAQVAWHIAAERERQAELADERRALIQAQTIARVGSWSMDPTTGKTEWSQEMCRIFDRAPDDGPRAFLSRLHPADRDLLTESCTRAIAQGEGFDLHGRVVHDDGEVLHLHAIGRREDDGRYTGTVQDITQAAHLREELTMASARLQAVLDHSPMGIYMRGLDGRYVIANHELTHILGVPAPQLIGRTVHEVLEPERAADIAASDQAVIADGEAVRFEALVPAGAGRDHPRTYLWHKFPVLDDGGEPLGVGGIALDMTDRVATERALRETDERFRGAFDGAPIGMAILDFDGRLTQANDALGAMLGYTRGELEGMHVRTISHPDDRSRSDEAIEEMRQGRRTSFNTEKRYLTAAGHPLSCALQASVLCDSDGRPKAVLSQIQDITDRKRHEQQLEHLADHDSLTGLLNRRAFTRELTSHAERGARYGPAGTVLMIDLDQFKSVNDTLGHHAGDETITRVAHLLGARLRTSDVLARLGGDEFAVLLPEAEPRDAEQVAESVLTSLHNQAIPVAGTERTITASIGIASFADQSGLSAEDIMINADLAMYDAKEAGRDRCATFTTGQHSQTRMAGRVSWAHRILGALEHDGFTLLAQPIVELATGATTQYELLLRMHDDDGDLIPPATFIYIAERLDLMTDIDSWVTTRAIEMLSAHPDLTLEVNLSARSLGDPRLLALIEAQLRSTAVAPERLIFEVTETTALTSVPRARAFGEQLSDLGCRFALDDFGAGFGSFYYLKHLVFDYLKIDGEFIRDCCANPTDQLVVRAIVDIARGMRKRTVAEFVSDDPTIELLNRLGVDYGQGYHLGAPAPLEHYLATAIT